MAETDAVAEFKRGVELLRDGSPGKAVEYFRSAAESEQRNPYYLSFLGLAVARAQKKWAPAVELCQAALRLKANEAQFYLNLAEVYLAAGQREDAVEVLDSAVKYFRRDSRVNLQRNKLGKRGNPVLPFLDRQHFLNRNLGQLRHQALRRFQKTKEE
jgi:Flp pilus assembly protein TadD